MPLKPVAIVIALLALAGVAALLIAVARRPRGWSNLFRVAPALCLLWLVVTLTPYIFGLSGPHPFYNRAASVAPSAVAYALIEPGLTPPGLINTIPAPYLIAVNARTGHFMWQRRLSDGQALLARGEGEIFCVSQAGANSQVSAFDSATGATRWSETLAYSIMSQPVVTSTGALLIQAYVINSPGGATLMALRASDGARLWNVTSEVSESAATRVQLALVGDTVFSVALGVGLQARSVVDGRLLWRAPATPDTLIAGRDVLYALSASGPVTAYRVTDGRQIWSVNQEGELYRAAGVGNTLVVTRQQTTPVSGSNGQATIPPQIVYALDSATGATRWRYSIQAPTALDLIADSQQVYIETSEGVRALRLSDGAPRWETKPSSVNWRVAPYNAGLGQDATFYATAIEAQPPETLTLFTMTAREYVYAVDTATGRYDWGAAVGPRFTLGPHVVY